MNIIRGSIVALVTPFNDDGEIDYIALQRLLDFHLQSGTNAILINGTTGESPTISLEEFDALTKYTVDYVNCQLPIIAGTGSNNTEQAIIRSQIAEYNGVDALLVVSPYYSKPSNKGIKQYFTDIANNTALPIIMYNVPGRTGSNMSIELILSLSTQIKNIIGIKEASGDFSRILQLINASDKSFQVYSGDDNLACAACLMGADGCISVVANQIPKVFSQMLEAAIAGERDIATNLHTKYADLMNLNFIESNPIPVKTSLAEMGLIKKVFRSPLCTMENENEDVLIQELVKLKLLKSVKEKDLILG